MKLSTWLGVLCAVTQVNCRSSKHNGPAFIDPRERLAARNAQSGGDFPYDSPPAGPPKEKLVVQNPNTTSQSSQIQ
jgi:hypothetical protein